MLLERRLIDQLPKKKEKKAGNKPVKIYDGDFFAFDVGESPSLFLRVGSSLVFLVGPRSSST